MVLNAPATCTSAGRCARTNSVADPSGMLTTPGTPPSNVSGTTRSTTSVAGPEVAAQTFEQFSEPVERHGEKHDIAPGRHFVVGDALDRKRRGGAVQTVDRVARPSGVARTDQHGQAGGREPRRNPSPFVPGSADNADLHGEEV